MITPEKSAVLELFAEGRRFYKLMEFVKAHDAFARAVALDPEDGPAKLYLDRCTYYIDNPPPEDWDGVFTMTTK